MKAKKAGGEHVKSCENCQDFHNCFSEWDRDNLEAAEAKAKFCEDFQRVNRCIACNEPIYEDEDRDFCMSCGGVEDRPVFRGENKISWGR